MMTMLLRVAVLAIVTAAAVPLAATAQQPGAPPKPTKAAALKVVQIITADKSKAKSYCDIAALGDEFEAAAQKKDDKKLDELSQKVDTLAGQIGPEYVALMNGLEDFDPDSQEGKEISGVLEGLDKICDAK